MRYNIKRDMKVSVFITLLLVCLMSFGCLAFQPDGYSVNATISGTSTVNATLTNTSVNATLYDGGSKITVEDNRVGTMAKDYFVGVAEGDIASHTAWSKIGFNADVGTSSEDIWGGSSGYVFPTVAQRMSVTSTSAQDGVGGTGVLAVYIEYLDTSFATHNETVTMNGLTSVNTTASDLYRINRLRATSVGSTGVAQGTITVSNTAKSVNYGYIQTGFTRDRDCIYTVPTGKTLYVTTIAFSCVGTKAVRLTTRATWDNIRSVALTAGTFFMPYNEVLLMDNAYVRDLVIPTRLPSGTDLKVSGIALSVGGAIVTCSLGGWLE